MRRGPTRTGAPSQARSAHRAAPRSTEKMGALTMGFLDWLARLLKLPARRQLVGNSSSDPRLTQSPEALCEAIDKAEARAADLARAYAAQLNDRQSFQARLMREQERAIDMARGKVTRELLDISDEIDRALGAAQGDESPLAQGIRLIHADLQKRLQSLGTKRLQLVGTRFDPNLAEAVEVVPVAQVGEDEMVLEEVRPGFMQNKCQQPYILQKNLTTKTVFQLVFFHNSKSHLNF